MRKLKTEFATAFLVNLVDDNGNPSWPERYSLQDCERVKRMHTSFVYSREYMNTPVEEGRLFKAEWIRYRTAKRLSSYPVLLGHWDLSYKTEGDYKAFALLGFDDEGLIVLDVFCRQCEISDAILYHFNLVKRVRDEGTGMMVFYDATASQEEVFGPLFQQEAQKQRIFELPIPDHTTNLDKFLRIEATLTNIFFNKQLSFAKHLEDTIDCRAAIEQILSFEKGSKAPDDFPDTLEAAVRLITKYAWSNRDESENKPVIGQRKRKGF